MKRSSSIAALDDTIDVQLGNKSTYEESVLVSSMMLVDIADENGRVNRLLRKHQSNDSMGSMSVTSSLSRCSSRGYLPGWGSAASRKSYKVDLCSLADEDCDSSSLSKHCSSSKAEMKYPTLTLQKDVARRGSITSVASDSLDSWGFFLE